jgi:L-asparaginase
VEIGKYQTSIDLGRIGVIGGNDITTESALTKLMFLLGNYKERAEIEALLKQSLRGEVSL